jgi:hypothetical protein
VGALDDDFAFVAESVSRAARLQRAPCEAVLADATRPGHALAGHLVLVYDAIAERVQNRTDKYALALDDAEREDAIVEMRRLVWEVRTFQSNLAWLEASQRPPLDLGTRYFVEDAARALVADDVEVTVVAADHLSYATSSDPWEPLIDDWGAGIPSGEPTVVVVFIPRREEQSGLLHPLIVHELGHAVDSEHGVVDRIWQVAQGRARLAARFSTAAGHLASASGADAADARDHLAKRLRFWIAECFCDCLAVHHLGPTYLYSFLTEVAAGSMDEAGARHPPPRQRIRLLMEYLDRLGWADVIRNGDGSLESWIRDAISSQPTYPDVERFLTWAVNELRAVVRKEVESALGGRVFRPDLDELTEVEELLAAGIPPAQRRTGEGVARESIILACWHAALSGAGGGPVALASAPDAPELAAVLPAALELSALVGAWDPA